MNYFLHREVSYSDFLRGSLNFLLTLFPTGMGAGAPVANFKAFIIKPLTLLSWNFVTFHLF